MGLKIDLACVVGAGMEKNSGVGSMDDKDSFGNASKRFGSTPITCSIGPLNRIHMNHFICLGDFHTGRKPVIFYNRTREPTTIGQLKSIE